MTDGSELRFRRPSTWRITSWLSMSPAIIAWGVLKIAEGGWHQTLGMFLLVTGGLFLGLGIASLAFRLGKRWW